MWPRSADRLPTDAVRPSVVSPGCSTIAALTRGASARNSGPATPATRSPTISALATPPDSSRSAGMGLAVANLERVGIGGRQREARYRHRLASPRVPTVVDLEKSAPSRSPERPRGRSRPDPDDVAGQSAVGQTADLRNGDDRA